MARSARKRGSVSEHRGKLNLQFYWHHPEEGAAKSYRWSVATGEKATESNKVKWERELESINAKIERDAFYPCTEFPDHKIANYCRCPSCLSVSPLAKAHVAPRTLKELIAQYKAFEWNRAYGDKKIIEVSTYKFKLRCLKALEIGFDYRDPSDGGLYEYIPLVDYGIRELTPESVKDWLEAFQHREEIEESNTTHYLKNIYSEIRQALEFGRFKQYWNTHPLLDYRGSLIQASKEEKSSKLNKLNFKPFSASERDQILGWLEKHYKSCDAKTYNGKERIRREFIYRYCVIGFNTGLRSPSEMTALEWPFIDYKNREINVCQSREASGRIDEQIIRPYTKTVKHRYVPINDMALESFRALENYRQEDSDAIFWNPRADKSNPFVLENGWATLTGEKRIRHTFDQALEALKIKNDTNNGQYRMRHTFTTLMLDHSSFSDAKVAALIGDNVETMKKHYAGFCENRWRGENDIDQLNAMNNQKKRKLKAVK